MQVWDPVLRAYVENLPDPNAHPLAAIARSDGYYNPVTGTGTSRDKARAGKFSVDPCDVIDAETGAQMLMHDDLAARIVEAPIEEIFRKGYELSIDDQTDPELAGEFTKAAKDLELNTHLEEAMIWGRGVGGAILYMNIDDGQDPRLPLNEKAIKSITSLMMFDARYARPASYYTDLTNPIEAINFGRPKSYWLVQDAVSSAPIAEVHESRCLRFGGALTDRRTRLRRYSWDLSVLERPIKKVWAFEEAFGSATTAMADFSQGVWGIEGMLNLIASGQSAAIGARIGAVDQTRSNARAIIIDKDKESFANVARSFASIPEMLDRFMLYLAAAIPMPVTILMGRSPAGMNATGDSDFQSWYDTCAKLQDKKGTPPIERFFRLLSLAKEGPSGGVEKTFCVKWRPLKEMTDKEQADLEYVTAQKDALYITNSVVTPEEIAIARFGGDEWSPALHIDPKTREEAQAAGTSFEPYPNDPEPEIDPNAPPPASGDTPPATDA